MRILRSNTPRLRLLTPLFCSISVLITAQVLAATPTVSVNADAERDNIVESGHIGYVGGSTRLGVSIDKDMQGQVDLHQIVAEDDVSATSVEGWFGYQLKDKNGLTQGVKGGGVKLNHLWAVGEGRYEDDTVHKVFAAYDRNADDHAKVSAGYGQEQQDLFWSGHISKGVSAKKEISGTAIKAYDYGVGAEIGTFLEDTQTRLRGGVDYEWGTDQADNEKKPTQATLSAGVQQYFYDSPHSITLDISASKKRGGDSKKETTASNARLGYQYEFGKNGTFQSDRRIKRTRVEIPGKPAIKAIPAIPAIAPIPAKPAKYAKKAISKPYIKLVKTTLKLENETFFKLNSARLTPSAKANLLKIAAEIRRNKYLGAIRITGNTCGLGSAKYDQILSERRARTVKQFLIKQGFNPAHLISKGLGKGHPKYPNGPESGFKNRRVDIEYVTQRVTKKKAYKTEYKNVLISPATKSIPGRAGTPGRAGVAAVPARFIWQTEEIKSAPLWIKRALHNPIRHKRSVDTYQTQTVPIVAPVDDDYTLVNRDSLLDVLFNDGTGLLLTDIVAAPAHGTASIENGKIRYIAKADYSGEDKFSYEVQDSNGNKQTAMVRITIPNDIANANVAPIAVNDELTTTINTPVTHNIISNDSDADGDTLSLATVSQPIYGTVTKNGNEIIYTPNAGFSGTDTFSYTVFDGKGHEAMATVLVKVIATTNTAPVISPNYAAVYGNASVMISVLEDDSDADGDALSLVRISEQPQYGTATIVGNKIQYQPNSNENKTDYFSYEATDNHGHTASALVTIDIKKQTEQHLGASDDYMQVDAGSTGVTLNVIANDSDSEGHSLTVSIIKQPAYGTAIASKEEITFIPDAESYKGSDSFEYKVCDAYDNCDTATVFVSGSIHTNSSPIISNIPPFTLTTGETTALDLTPFITDIDQDTLSIATAEALSGSLTFSNLTLYYTPKENATEDRINFSVDDDNGGTATGVIMIKINR